MGENGMLGEGNPDLKDQEAEKEVLAQCTVHTDIEVGKHLARLEQEASQATGEQGYRQGWKWRQGRSYQDAILGKDFVTC